MQETSSSFKSNALCTPCNDPSDVPSENFLSRFSSRLRNQVRLYSSAITFGVVATTVLAVAITFAYALWPVEAPPSPSLTSLAPNASVAAHQAAAAAPRQQKKRFNPLRGIATWYGAVLHGHPTASGEIFDESKMTACHNSLPFGTRVRVTDLSSNKSVIVRINDRGVLAKGRVIDLSSAAARQLGILRAGMARVKLDILKSKTFASEQTEQKQTENPSAGGAE